MKKTDIFWQEIRSEIAKELENIEKLHTELKNLPTGAENRRAEGSVLHDFYNCCERIFRKIATDINGGFGRSETWHKGLLYRMTIAINDVRPQVLSEELAAELDDYLAFRHVFRNIYGFELKGDRLDRLVAKFGRVSHEFQEQIEEFLDKMEQHDQNT